MSLARNVWADLVEKRLWPVALALLVALVAIPVLLTKPAPEPPAAIAVAPAGPAPLVTDPAAIVSNPDGGPVGGEVKNPFAQQHVPKASSSDSTAGAAGPDTASSSGGSGAETDGGGSSGGSGGGSTGGSTGDSDSDAGSEDSGPTVKVKFGPSDGKRTVRTLTSGTPLPSVSSPYIVFVTVAKDGKTAEFLVSADAKAQGDGRCEPSKDICSALFMQDGHTEFFDVTGEKGTVQYQLEILEVSAD